MKSRTELLEYFKELGFKKGAEVGVAYGIFSKRMLDVIPNLNLLCVDCWGSRKRHHCYSDAIKTLGVYPGANIICATSMVAVRQIPHRWLDFVYIDANHTYESVLEDITGWTKRVRRGGIVSGHDYYLSNKGNLGVIQAVDEFVKSKNYQLNVTDWNKNDPNRDERQPSWWFVKT